MLWPRMDTPSPGWDVYFPVNHSSAAMISEWSISHEHLGICGCGSHISM